jgi:hypothetical protein
MNFSGETEIMINYVILIDQAEMTTNSSPTFSSHKHLLNCIALFHHQVSLEGFPHHPQLPTSDENSKHQLLIDHSTIHCHKVQQLIQFHQKHIFATFTLVRAPQNHQENENLCENHCRVLDCL